MAALTSNSARGTLGKCFHVLQGTVAKERTAHVYVFHTLLSHNYQACAGSIVCRRKRVYRQTSVVRKVTGGEQIRAGLPRRWNETREFADTPDWTFNDGRPTPLIGCQKKRYLQQLEYCATIVKYLKEINEAQETTVHLAQEEEEVKKRVASGKFKQKGINELKIHQPTRAKQVAKA